MGDTLPPDNDSVDEFLAHYGVKGMKWGVKRAASKVGATAKAFNEYGKLPAGVKVRNELNAYKTVGKFVAKPVTSAVKSRNKRLAEAGVKYPGGKTLVVSKNADGSLTKRKPTLSERGQIKKINSAKPGSPEHETVKAILKKGGAKNLTNAEIQVVNTRLQLETSFKTLTAQPSTLQKGNKAVKDVLDVIGTVDRAYKTTSGPSAQAFKKTLKK